MNAKEISDTLIELQRKLNKKEVFETDKKQYYIKTSELNFFYNNINRITNNTTTIN